MNSFKLMVITVCILVSTVAISATAHHSTTTNADNKLGKQVFEAHCSACHEGGNNTVEPTKTLKLEALKKFGFNSVDDIKKRVIEGKAIMPSFKETLKASEIEAVADYVWNQAQTSSWR